MSNGEQHIETKRFRYPRALDFDTASGLLNRRALTYHDVSFGNWYEINLKLVFGNSEE